MVLQCFTSFYMVLQPGFSRAAAMKCLRCSSASAWWYTAHFFWVSEGKQYNVYQFVIFGGRESSKNWSYCNYMQIRKSWPSRDSSIPDIVSGKHLQEPKFGFRVGEEILVSYTAYGMDMAWVSFWVHYGHGTRTKWMDNTNILIPKVHGSKLFQTILKNPYLSWKLLMYPPENSHTVNPDRGLED